MSMRTIVRLCMARTWIGGVLGHVPLVRWVYARYALSRHHHPGIFCGVYASYDAALADIPSTRRAGWDNAEAASIWLDQPDPVAPSTYPVFFWLTQIARNDTTLLDYGGSIGVTYYGFRRRAIIPPGLRWIVAEVPHMAEQGRITAAQHSATCLEFVTDIAAAPPADILISAGALQYMQRSVPGLLEMIAYRPRHIILNKLPLTAGDSYWTLQNFGPAISPYRIFNKDRFMRYFETAGYTVRDEWPVTDLSCDIPFRPRHAVSRFTGMLLEHTAAAAQRQEAYGE